MGANERSFDAAELTLEERELGSGESRGQRYHPHLRVVGPAAGPPPHVTERRRRSIWPLSARGQLASMWNRDFSRLSVFGPTPVLEPDMTSQAHTTEMSVQEAAPSLPLALVPAAGGGAEHAASLPVPERLFGRRHVPAAVGAAAKRTLDVAVSGTLLLALLPLILLAALLIKLDSRGPVFYCCDRVGFHGRRMRMLKFRKMHHDASGMALTTDDDQRFTRIGVWLAKTKVDEIPQLWHVLIGEMSLVGPRPEDRRFVDEHASDYEVILGVRPGMTGLSQIAFAEESRILDDENPLVHYLERILPQKVGLDRMYARSRTLLFDLRILFWTTAAVILRRQVAVHRSSGTMNLRRR